MSTKIFWRAEAPPKDYEAAFYYMTLLLDTSKAHALQGRLYREEMQMRRANDLLRAARREPLPADDPGVLKALRHIRQGVELSPILFISFPVGGDIADGYHRVSAAYQIDPFMDVPCKIVSA